MRLTYFLWLFFLLSGVSAPAQKNQRVNIPPEVSQAFVREYSGASDVEWHTNDSLYEVEFEFGDPKKDQLVAYNQRGMIVYHKQELNIDALPAAVIKEVRRSFPGFQFGDIERVEQSGKTGYLISIEKEAEEWILYLDAQGQILEKKEI